MKWWKRKEKAPDPVTLLIYDGLLDMKLQLNRIVGKLDTLIQKETQEMSAVDDISVALDETKAAADAASAGQATAIAILDGIAAKLDELTAAQGDPAAVLA